MRKRWQDWIGISAACAALLAALRFLSVYVHAVRVTPVDKALVDSLKEKASGAQEVREAIEDAVASLGSEAAVQLVGSRGPVRQARSRRARI